MGKSAETLLCDSVTSIFGNFLESKDSIFKTACLRQVPDEDKSKDLTLETIKEMKKA